MDRIEIGFVAFAGFTHSQAQLDPGLEHWSSWILVFIFKLLDDNTFPAQSWPDKTDEAET